MTDKWESGDAYWGRKAGAGADNGDTWGKTLENQKKDYDHWKKTGRHLDAHGRRNVCFVATAVYGSYDCPEVMKLRAFRDNILLKSRPGRSFVNFYYQYGSNLADVVKERKWLSVPTKFLLNTFIKLFLSKKA
jgi:hypothetical protein